MGKIKSWMMEQEERYMEDFDYDHCLYEYQQQLVEEQLEEQLIKEGQKAYQMDHIEQQSYQLYMEGKLCGEPINIARTNSDTNLKGGQTTDGQLRKPRTRK